MHKVLPLIFSFIFAIASPAFAQSSDVSDSDISPTPLEATSSTDNPRTSEMSQKELDRQAEEAVAACGFCGGSITFLIILGIGILVLNIAILVWVARDAKNRSMDNAVLWMLLVMFTGLIGLIIYFCSRPSGELIQCSSCGNKRLKTSAKCPHCQNP